MSRRELTEEESKRASNLKRVWEEKRGELGLTQTSAADALGVTQGAVGQYINGRIPLNDGAAMQFAKLLKVHISQISNQLAHDYSKLWVENASEAANQGSHRKAPVISWVQAGEWSEASEPEHYTEWKSISDTDSDDVFWLRVVGDSMTSPHGISAPEGSLIKVDPNRQADNGSLVVAKLADSHEATFKKLVIDAGRKYLMPLNTAYPTLEVNGNCVIVGVVTEVRIQTI